jgi:hypothetical protein
MQSSADFKRMSSYSSTNSLPSSLSTSQTALNNPYAQLQAQFEMSVEMRRFINIDLFQRGYYQIRLSVKMNKQFQSKVVVHLENNSNNNNLSGNFESILLLFLLLLIYLFIYLFEKIQCFLVVFKMNMV